MAISFPWALVLLALLPVTALFGISRLRRLPGRRGPIAMALRMAVLALLVIALSGPEWRILESRVSTVFLVDASNSVGAGGQHAAMDWAAQAVKSSGHLDRSAVVLFGAAPRLVVPLAHYDALPDPADQSAAATNIGAALNLGLSILPDDSPGRLVLLSDGQDTGDNGWGPTDGNSGVSNALALAISRGVPIDTVAIAPPRRRDVAVRDLSVPGTARVGDQVPLRITLYSSLATNATLTIWIDGAAAQQTIALSAGTTTLGAVQRLDTIGVHTFRVRIDTPGDAVPQNNSLDAATVVAPPGKVLLAVDDPTIATSLATTLQRGRIDVTPILASNLPSTARGYHAYDGVILDDVPATSLTRKQQEALRGAVYSNGLGLLTVGGPNSYGEGKYAHTTLEDALPVLSVNTPRRASAPIALMLVIDKSGSMSDQVAGVAKIDMVKVAATSALDKLDIGDAVGVLAFDDTNHWIVPFHVLQGAADKAHIKKQIATLGADGDTYIYPALSEAERAVLRVPTVYRHIVLLTDGQGEDADFVHLIRRMRREHITLSTIGVGQDVVRDELSQWAKLGGGVFHYVADPHTIPRIVVNETRYGTAGTAEVRGRVQLGVASASPLLRDLAGRALPRIAAYDSSVAKTTAQVAVQSAAGDPILSSWQYGLGRAVAWTSDAPSSSSGDGWARSWSPEKLPSFWVDLVRWTLRGYNAGSAVPALRLTGGQLQVSTSLRNATGGFDDSASPRVRVAYPDGSAQVVSLALSGPGLYTAELPVAGQGIYEASFVRNDRAPAATAQTAALVIPYPAEYASDGVDAAFLTHVAEATGGSILTRPSDSFSHAGLAPAVGWLPLWPYLLALSLLLFVADVGVRLLLPPDPAYLERA